MEIDSIALYYRIYIYIERERTTRGAPDNDDSIENDDIKKT